MISLKRETTFPIGLQIGPTSVTAAQLRERAGVLELSAAARAAMRIPGDATDEECMKRTAEAIRELLSDSRFKGRRVVGCLTMDDLFVQNVRLPKLAEDEAEKVVRWEAAERLPYPVDDAEIRHWLAAEIRQETDVKQERILMSCRKQTISRCVELLERANLVPVGIDVEPCAVLRGLTPRTEVAGQTRRVCVNLCEQATSVIIESADRIQFLKHIDGGGQTLDQAVADHLQLSQDEAATLRGTVTAAATLNPEDDIHRCVIDAIREPLESIADEIERCLRYDKVTFREQPPAEITLSGAEATAWLAEFLSDRLGTPCRLGNPFRQLDCQVDEDVCRERPWQWTTAVGLSIKQPLPVDD